MAKELQIKLSLYVEVEDKDYIEDEIKELESKILDELFNKDLSTIDKRILPSDKVNINLYDTKIEELD